MQEIKRLDAGKGEAIPTFQKVIDLIDRRMMLVIELKEEGTERSVLDLIMMKYTFVDREFVKIAHDKGLKVFIWNIDDQDLLKPYVDMGVDAIGTNDPMVLVKYFR